MSKLQSLNKYIMTSQVWKSIFRYDFEDTPANHGKVIRTNVLLHRHPIRIPKHALKIRFTWCMVVVTIVLLIWALMMDAPLGEIATPSRTENPAKAPWYLFFIRQSGSCGQSLENG